VSGTSSEFVVVGSGVSPVSGPATLASTLAASSGSGSGFNFTSVEAVPTDQPFDSYTQHTTLSGVEYILRFDWSSRASAWFLSLFSADGTPIIQSRKLIPYEDVLSNVIGSARPPGALLLMEASLGFDRPTQDGLQQQDWQLLYLT
jgi:hypothetical protein